jgi:hypothetical protein
MKFPQGLKPLILLAIFGTTEVVPFQDPIVSASFGFAQDRL